MASIRAIRQATPFDPRCVERHPLFWPLRRAAAAFGACADWPDVATWSAVFAPAAAPICFVPAPPPPRRQRAARRPSLRYDAAIAERALVPSRRRNWHDFANALVWGTFPRAKAALHRRQHTLVAARLDGARLPAHRSREQDGLAMIDEGGVVALVAPDRELRLVFGHAVYEGLVLGVPSMTARLVRLDVPAVAPDAVAQADAALAERLWDPAFSTLPESLPRVFVPDDAQPPWA